MKREPFYPLRPDFLVGFDEIVFSYMSLHPQQMILGKIQDVAR